MEAISHAGAALGILAKDGVVLAAEKLVTSKLLDSVGSEKLYLIDDHIACVVSGITADANILVSQSRVAAQQYLLTYHEPMPVGACRRLCLFVSHACVGQSNWCVVCATQSRGTRSTEACVRLVCRCCMLVGTRPLVFS